MRRFVPILIISVILILSLSNQAKSYNRYCSEYYDDIRLIRYWARASISISDYKFNSGDIQALKLTIPGSIPGLLDQPIKPIKEHFITEFNRLLKGNLPFHDADVGREERFMKMRSRQLEGEKGFFQKFAASEEARRNALYGLNAAAFYCDIRVSRKDFPVLYEISCNISTEKDLANVGSFMKSTNIGFSTPDHITDEIKRAITDCLTEIGEKMTKVRKCSPKTR